MSLFDNDNLTNEPTKVIAGDLIQWRRQDLGNDYPPASYTLKYSARMENTGDEIEITATADGTDFVISVASADSGTWSPGRYYWQAYIIRDSDNERVTIDSGMWEVVANRDASTADPRGHAKKMLDAVEAALEAFSHGVSSYTLPNGATVTRRDSDELLKLRSKYRFEYQQELARLGSNEPPRHIGIRFRRI